MIRLAASGIDALQDLERYLSGQAALGAGLSEIERESERRGREIVRLSLQAHVDARGDGDVGEAIVLAGEDGSLRLAHKRVHSRPLVTLFRGAADHTDGVRRAGPRCDPPTRRRALPARAPVEL